MPVSHAHDHSPAFEQLAGLSALGALEGDDRAQFEAHRAGCERCQLVVRLDGEALRCLTTTAPEMDPSPNFKARLMQRAAEELDRQSIGGPPVAPTAPRLTDVSKPSNVIPFYRRTAVLRGLAAVFVVGLLSLGAFTYENQPVAQVALHGDAPGEALVTIRRSGAAELEMRNVPDPGPGYVYEAWIIPQGQVPITAGVVTNGNGRVTLEGDVRGKTIAITREPGRLPLPTGQPLMSAAVQS